MEINLLVVSAIVVGLTEIFKSLKFDKIWTVIFTFLAGLFIVAIAAPYIGLTDYRGIILNSLIVSLQAMGLYSGGKALIEKNR